jgi:hypothetical protein
MPETREQRIQRRLEEATERSRQEEKIKGGIASIWESMNPAQKIGMSPVGFPVTDIIGAAGDAKMYLDEPETRSGLNYALSGLGLLPFVPAAASTVLKKTKDTPMTKLFHGTRHEWEGGKPDLEYFDTGEGSQGPFGRGIHFVTKPEIGKRYQFTQKSRQPGETVEELMKRRKFPVTGRIYETEIPSEYMDQMLDLSKNLSEQSKPIKTALKKMGAKIDAFKKHDPVLGEVLPDINFKKLIDEGDQSVLRGLGSRKAEAMAHGMRTDSMLFLKIYEDYLGMNEASKLFDKAGIRGTKYRIIKQDYPDYPDVPKDWEGFNVVVWDPDVLAQTERAKVLTEGTQLKDPNRRWTQIDPNFPKVTKKAHGGIVDKAIVGGERYI